MPRIPAHLRECALGMLQGGMKTADVARVSRLLPKVAPLPVRMALGVTGLLADTDSFLPLLVC